MNLGSIIHKFIAMAICNRDISVYISASGENVSEQNETNKLFHLYPKNIVVTDEVNKLMLSFY